MEIELKVKEVLNRHFRPEFLNRIDETVVFSRLTRDDLRGIGVTRVPHVGVTIIGGPAQALQG